MGKWKSRIEKGCGHGSELAHGHELRSGSHVLLPIIMAVCDQDQLLHVCSACSFSIISVLDKQIKAVWQSETILVSLRFL